jgi:hypothetical protein
MKTVDGGSHAMPHGKPMAIGPAKLTVSLVHTHGTCDGCGYCSIPASATRTPVEQPIVGVHMCCKPSCAMCRASPSFAIAGAAKVC